MANDKRLAMLEKMTAAGEADSFTWYALALEYRSHDRVDDALATFKTLRGRDSDYVPMYLICGTMLAEAQRDNEGREWLESGLVKASEKGETHALSELQDALNAIAPPQSLP
mgnify:CR=1 FL=1